MLEILPLLHCLSPYISQTTLGQLGVIITALLTMSGRVTMLGISRPCREGRQLSDDPALLLHEHLLAQLTVGVFSMLTVGVVMTPIYWWETK